jgi:hypothetical protein
MCIRSISSAYGASELLSLNVWASAGTETSLIARPYRESYAGVTNLHDEDVRAQLDKPVGA